MIYRSRFLVAGALAGLVACGGADDSGSSDDGDVGGKADDSDAAPVCLQRAVFPNSVLASALADTPGAVGSDGAAVIANYTAWPIYDPTSQTARMDSDITDAIADPEDALENIADRYGDCSADVAEHMRTKKPNVYIYFTGFGGPDQNNSIVEQGSVLRWINDRDPNALIFSINWNCAASDDAFCSQNTAAIASGPDAPHVRSMTRAIDVIVPQIATPDLAEQLKATIGQFGQQQQGYDSAHSHSMELAAKLIDQLLVADQGRDGESLIGDIHVAGYSMGAHSAAQLLVQDFNGAGGFDWSVDGCADGGNRCTVAGLDKVKWSLAMGLSGWAHALHTHNGIDGDGMPTSRESDDLEQYQNGGLYRVSDPNYAGKLAVLNRRMDPTSNSDDTFQRGFLDIFYGDYNHYSHDYSLPLFIDKPFVRALDAFLESGTTVGSKELGIIYDNASKVDFDECPRDGTCEAATGYVAHEINRSHAVIDVPRVAVQTVDGVEHPESVNNRAATFATADARPIALRTFDQEDLRGGVELYLRPQYDVGGSGLHGVFSYGSCGGSDEDLMPQAFIEDGQLTLTMSYEGQRFAASIDAVAAGLAQDEWTHLAFTWELPVESLTPRHRSANELGAALPGMIGDLQRHQVALVLATGLTKSLATTYKRQAGQGTMTIYVNGEPAVEAPLGTVDSQRECMAAADVIASEPYEVNGEVFPAFVPYARYDAQSGDVVAFSPDQVLGTKCKAYKIRNTQAVFGCAQSDGANADADMDDITLIWGPGRTDYDNIDHATGAPVTWPIGVEYGSAPFRK